MALCCRASRRGAAADDAVLPLRCQASRRRHVIATATLFLPPCCHAARHRRPAALLPLSSLFLLSSLLPPPPRFCRCRRAAVDALLRRCRVGWSFWRLVGRLIGWLVGPNASYTTSLGLTFQVHDCSSNLGPDLDRAKKIWIQI
jgi:hypothetical protein